MIVTCERCATQFELDDSRVPEGGVRVRCSRCKHAFEIRRPAPPAKTATEEEESDWEFNEDLPGSRPPPGRDGIGRDAATYVVDDLLGADDPAETPETASELFGSALRPSGLDLEDEPPPPAEKREAAAEAPPETAPVEAPRAPVPKDSAKAPAKASGPEDLFGAEVEDPSGLELAATAAAEEAAPADPKPAGDELESPEDWDLLDGAEGESPDFGASGSQGATIFEVDPDELIDDRPPWQAGLYQAGNVLGWLAVATLLGVGLFAGLRPAQVAAAAPIPLAGGLEIAEMSGRLIDHLGAGPIYVVTGRLRNAGRGRVEAPWLGVELVDEAGGVVTRPALLQPLHATAALREEPLAQLALARAAGRAPLRPGETRAFEAVVGPLPDCARRIQVVPVPAPLVVEAAASAAVEGADAAETGLESATAAPASTGDTPLAPPAAAAP